MTTPQSGVPRQIFVVGNSRSGTTLLARMLGEHSAIHTTRELHFVEEMWTPEDGTGPVGAERAQQIAERLLHNARLRYQVPFDPAEFRDDARALVAGLPPTVTAWDVFATVLATEAERANKTIGCEQTPRNVFYLPEILEALPEAQIITIVRDPRDVLLSQKNWWRKKWDPSEGVSSRKTSLRHWVNFHPLTTSLIWRGGIVAGARARDNDRVHTIRFEDLTANPEHTMRGLFTALGLSFEPATLEVARHGSTSGAPQDSGVGVDATRVGNWQGGLSPAEIWFSHRVNGELMREWGYAPTPVKAGPSVAASMASWPVKAVLAFALNRNRSRSVGAAIRRRLGH